MATLHLVPAYGRDYKSKAEVEEDFQKDKDFLIQDVSSHWNGKYTNLEDLLGTQYTEVNIRYKKLTQVCVLPVRRSE